MNGDYIFEGIIGKSLPLQRIIELIKKVAVIDAPILVQGESGTGKELVARAIARRSNRHDRPFVPVNCGAFPESLLESELFGHEKGAFTGAISTRKGAFETASGGTLFLDEIGDTTPSMQVSLLRVLQDGVIRRVGGTGFITTDARLISATNKDLKQALEDNEFREDLYYRINVITINIPPLRDRMDDLPILVNEFIHTFSEKLKKKVTGVSPKVMERLYRYMWPGNIRELKNVIERAVIMCSGATIQKRDLPPTFNESIANYPRRTRKTDMTFQEAKEQLEKVYFMDLYRRVKGNISKAAEQSGLDRKTVRKIIKKHGITAEF